MSLFQLDAYATSGTSPTAQPKLTTVHLVGPGTVGRELLRQLDANRFRLVGVTDRGATVHHPLGLARVAVADFKTAGLPLAQFPGAEPIPSVQALQDVRADVVVDCTASDLEQTPEASRRGWTVLQSGRQLVLAAKNALAAEAAHWLTQDFRHKLGCNAALGGTGLALKRDLPRLRASCQRLVVVGNASTAAIIGALESGADFDSALEQARQAGLLEPDPTSDLCGVDLAVKLAIVVGAVTGKQLDPATLPEVDLRTLELHELRERVANGLTTRLVGRWERGSGATLAFEALPRTSPLALPPDEVLYRYDLDGQDIIEHRGRGLGPQRTAEAVIRDLESLNPAQSAVIQSPRPTAVHRGVARFEPSTQTCRAEVAYLAAGPVDTTPLVVLGGISADREFQTWWHSQIGAGRAIDPAKRGVIGIDFLGGRGASQLDPSWPTDRAGTPLVSTHDQAAALRTVLDELGVSQVAAIAGASYGGMVGLAFAELYPERCARLLLISAAECARPFATALRTIQRRVVRACDEESGLPLARALALTGYRTHAEFRQRYDSSDGRQRLERYFDHCGARFVEKLDRRQFLCLSESLDRHAVVPERVRTPTSLLGATDDALVPAEQLRELATRLAGPTHCTLIPTLYGHDAFLKEHAAVDGFLRTELVREVPR